MCCAQSLANGKAIGATQQHRGLAPSLASMPDHCCCHACHCVRLTERLRRPCPRASLCTCTCNCNCNCMCSCAQLTAHARGVVMTRARGLAPPLASMPEHCCGPQQAPCQGSAHPMAAARKVRAAPLLCTYAYYASGRAVMAGARSLACVFADAQVPSRAHG